MWRLSVYDMERAEELLEDRGIGYYYDNDSHFLIEDEDIDTVKSLLEEEDFDYTVEE